MSSNAVFQTTVVLLLLAHLGALLGVWYGPRTMGIMLSLNGVIAAAILAYAVSRARYSLGHRQLGLIVLELAVLAGAIWAFRHNRSAIVWSYVVFGFHFLITIAATIFAFGFKMTRLF